jgi:hypothetical protein
MKSKILILTIFRGCMEQFIGNIKKEFEKLNYENYFEYVNMLLKRNSNDSVLELMYFGWMPWC